MNITPVLQEFPLTLLYVKNQPSIWQYSPFSMLIITHLQSYIISTLAKTSRSKTAIWPLGHSSLPRKLYFNYCPIYTFKHNISTLHTIDIQRSDTTVVQGTATAFFPAKHYVLFTMHQPISPHRIMLHIIHL